MAKANVRYANGHRRRELRARVLAAYDTCALCGQPVDRTLRLGPDGKPHPLSPEVDEIIPVSRGGNPLAWSNVQLTHRRCNRAKSNMSDGAARALIGRQERANRTVQASPDW